MPVDRNGDRVRKIGRGEDIQSSVRDLGLRGRNRIEGTAVNTWVSLNSRSASFPQGFT